MQFFWKHLHNNKGDENVSKLIWIVIAFVIGALLLSTMSVAFRTEGEGSIGGWLNSTIDSWFGEADGRDGSTGGGTGSGGGLGGGGGSGGGAGGREEAFTLTGIILSYDASSQTLTSNNELDGKNYTNLFTNIESGSLYETSAYLSANGISTSGNNLLDPEAVIIDISSVTSDEAELFATGTKVVDTSAYIGVDENGHVVSFVGDEDPTLGGYIIVNITLKENTSNSGNSNPGNVATACESMIFVYNANSKLLTTDNPFDGKNYTTFFEEQKLESEVITSLSFSRDEIKDSTDSGTSACSKVLDITKYPNNMPMAFAPDTKIIQYNNEDEIFFGIDERGNAILAFDEVYFDNDPMDGYFYIVDIYPINDESQNINQNDTIPQGGIYYVGVTSTTVGDYSGATEILTEGQPFPDTVSDGDIYIYDDYVYRYNYATLLSYSVPVTNLNIENIDDISIYSGWGVAPREQKAYYNEMLSTVAGKPVTLAIYTYYNNSQLIKTPIMSQNIKIAAYTFTGCSSLQKADNLPESIVNLEGAFGNCKNLTSAKIPPNVKSLTRTFSGCSKLETAPEIPYGVTFASGAFQKCFYLKTVSKIPDSVIDMEDMFRECTSLVTAPELSKNVEDLSLTFGDCTSLKNVPSIPASAKDLSETFRNCMSLVTAPVFPEGIENLDHTFNMCSALTTVPELPSTIKGLYGTFSGCTSLKYSPVIPDGVTDMSNTFNGCTSLQAAPAIPDSVKNMNGAFEGCTALISAPSIGKGVEYATNAFNGCKSLTGTIRIESEKDIFYKTFYGTAKPITVQVKTGSNAYSGLVTDKNNYSYSNVTIQTF